MSAGLPVAATGGPAGALGLPAVAGVLTLMEAGVPVPLPSDVLLLALGAGASEGSFPVLVVVVALELVVAVGTTALFFAIRGPGQVLLTRFGPRLGLTPERLARATRLVDRRGRAALVLGRATPGLRTVTVAAAAGSQLSPARALVPLIVGSSVFVQLHLALGYAFGPAARAALDEAKGPAIAVIVLAVVAGIVFWLVRRGRRAGVEAASEACCPACLALGALAPRAFSLGELES